MSWVKMDDQFFRHPKARGAGKDGRGLFFAGLCYCASQLTNGFIREDMVPLLVSEAEATKNTPGRLVEVNLWELAEGGYRVHDYLDYNPSAEKVKADREKAKQRMNRGRSSPEQPPEPPANNGRSSASPSRPVPSLGEQAGGGGSPVLAPNPNSLLRDACSILAQRVADQRPRDDRTRYVQAVLVGKMNDHASEAERLMASDDGWTAEKLADALEPPARSVRVVTRDERECPLGICGGSFVVEQADGSVRQCDCVRAA